MATEFGLQELYGVTLKTTYPIEISDRTLAIGETVAAFDSIQIANLREVMNRAQASGGYDNRGLVYWETTKEVQLTLNQGIFSKTQLSVMLNAHLAKTSPNTVTLIQREAIESDENCIVHLKYSATNRPIFVYDLVTGKPLEFTIQDNSHLIIGAPFKEVLVDYQYLYDNTAHTITIGKALTNGFLQLDGRTRVKDDITGQTHTGIIHIPKLKLMSELSMRLGRNATPIVGTLNATAVPTGDREHTTVMEIVLLDDDIDSDM